MGRKEGSSFKALIDYIMRDDACDQNHILHHNLLGRTRDEVVAELEQNARCLKKRKNGNAAYHEVVSIRCVPGMDREEQKRKLVEIAERYVRMRAPNCLVLGALHDDHDDHIHIHLLISANELGESKRHRLTKAAFRKIAIEMERRVLADYPELKQDVAIEKEAKVKRSRQASAMKARTGRLPVQDSMAADLVQVFQSVGSINELHEQMKLRELAFYQRGKIVGVINTGTGKRHRLPTLGIDGDYETMKARLLGRNEAQDNAQEHKRTTADATRDETHTIKETGMLDLTTLLQGVGALADVVSLSDTLRSSADAGAEKSQAEVASERQASAAQKKTDREIIAEARRAEMEKLRSDRESARSKTLTRRR